MPSEEHQEKVAILLNALGDDAVEPALTNVDPDKANTIRERLEQLKKNPLPTAKTESVLDEFERYFKFAVEAVNAENYWSKITQPIVEPKMEEVENNAGTYSENGILSMPMPEPEEEEVDPAPVERFKIFQPSENEMSDLKKLHPMQIAEALKSERPKTIAIVLSCLSEKKNASVIEQLPESMHGELLNLLISDVKVQPELQRRIVKTVVQNALQIEAPENSEPDPVESIVGVMRELPRHLRNNMLEHLKETDEENAEKIQKMLFRFEDVVGYEDRSIQKILAEVDKSQLVLALQGADSETKDCILRNLSNRAKESLEEELELLGKQPPEVTKDAQNSIAEVIARLDQSDQLESA